MAAKEFLSHIDFKTQTKKTKALPQIVLFFGKNYTLHDEMHAAILLKLRQTMPEIEDIRLNGFEVKAAAVHSELSTIPMFQSGRLISLKHADTILKDIESNKTVLPYFIRDLANIPELTYLLIQIDEPKDVKKPKLPKAFSFLEKDAWVFFEKRMYENQVPGFLATRIKEMGYQAENGVVDRIAEKSAFDVKQALSALDRLFTYTLAEKNILLADVDEVCTDLEGDLQFAISDSLASRKCEQAMVKILQNKIANGNILLAAWVKLFGHSLRFHYLNQCGLSREQIKARIGPHHDFAFKKEVERFNLMYRHYSLNELHRITERLTSLDKKMKENSSIEAQRTLLIMFVASLQN